MSMGPARRCLANYNRISRPQAGIAWKLPAAGRSLDACLGPLGD
jgi:hypothetical protein